VGGAAAGSALHSLDQPSDKAEADAQASRSRRAAASPQARDTAPPQPRGYVFHLTNGRTISVAHYEDRGEQVVISQRAGSYGLPKSIIARIEAR
jgi:hypothetical protein